MYYTYVIKSIDKSRYYVGSCADLDKRLKRHNAGFNKSTKIGIPWKIVHTESFETRQQAYKRELQIKSYKGGNGFKKLITLGEVA